MAQRWAYTAGCSLENIVYKERNFSPQQLGLYVAIDGQPAERLRRSVDLLFEEHELEIRIISVTKLDRLEVYCPE